MALSSEVFKTVFSCIGGLTYDALFKILDDDDVEVILRVVSSGAETVLVKGTSYTISLMTDSGFRITTMTAYSNLYELIARRKQPMIQELDYTQNDQLSTVNLENQFDKEVMMIQSMQEKVNRGFLQNSSKTTPLILPVPVANALLGWDAAATAIENKVASTLTIGELTFIADYSNNLNTAIATIGVATKCLIINKAITLTASAVVPSNIQLVFLNGGSITKAAAFTLTINGPLSAGLFKIFNGFTISGDVTFGLGSITYVYPEWFGAVGDSTTDDSSAITAMIEAIPAYSVVKLSGIYKIASQISINKNISLSGIGPSSGFYLAIDTSTDGILLGLVESASGTIHFVKWSNFGIYGNTDSCRNALVLTGVMQSKFEDIHIKAGTHIDGYAVWARWCIENYFGFVIDYQAYYPVTAIASRGGFKASKSDGTANTVFIDNTLDVIIDGHYGKGIYLMGADDCEIKGICTGIRIPSIGTHLIDGNRNHIHNFYSEASMGDATGNEIVLENEVNTRIGAGVVSIPGDANKDVKLIGCTNIVIDGLFCSMLEIDSVTQHTRIEQITCAGQVGAGITDNGINTIQLIADTWIPTRNATGLLSDFSAINFNGSFERWISTAVPAGVTWINSGITITRETTIKCHGVSSAKIDTAGTDASSLRLDMPAQIFTSNPRGKMTVTGWIYIPTAGGQNVLIAAWYDSGANTETMAIISKRDEWVKVTFNMDNTYNGLYSDVYLMFYTLLAGTFYIDGVSVTPGVAGGASLFTPNANEFPKYTGSETWDPGSIAASGYLAKDFTVLGAALGMVAQAGAGVDVTDLIVSATVTAANTVTVVLFNPTVGAIDLASSAWRVSATDISN